MKPVYRIALSALVPLTIAATSAPAAAWGQTGHRVSGELAQRNISGHTRAHVALILGNEGLAEASTWPDEEKSNPAEFWQHTASPWHYVTLPPPLTAEMLEHPSEGDAATALEAFSAVLRDPSASLTDKQMALRFIVHIVGDLHQPLHVGNGTDRGGNDFRVTWFGEPSNLHTVWDTKIIENQNLSYTEYADRLETHTTPAETVAWWNAVPAVWMNESAALRDRIYPETGGDAGEGTRESPVALSYRYPYDWTPVVEQRLQMAGVRIAAYLDQVFAGVPAPR